jgi:hypothetical protein
MPFCGMQSAVGMAPLVLHAVQASAIAIAQGSIISADRHRR